MRQGGGGSSVLQILVTYSILLRTNQVHNLTSFIQRHKYRPWVKHSDDLVMIEVSEF